MGVVYALATAVSDPTTLGTTTRHATTNGRLRRTATRRKKTERINEPLSAIARMTQAACHRATAGTEPSAGATTKWPNDSRAF